MGGTTAGRAPRNHRAAGALCPAARGPAKLPDGCNPDAGMSPAGLADCLRDTDCTAGSNGRCTSPPIFAICGLCSYDDCAADADCPGGAPCQCRASETDGAPNRCQTASNCTVDADCGPGGFCSPSVVDDFCFCPSTALCAPSDKCYAGTTEVRCACGDSCGHGYFCHTKADTCLDDEDCGTSGSCNFDKLAGRWQCALCWPIP
jgi:hypothetical protein